MPKRRRQVEEQYHVGKPLLMNSNANRSSRIPGFTEVIEKARVTDEGDWV